MSSDMKVGNLSLLTFGQNKGVWLAESVVARV